MVNEMCLYRPVWCVQKIVTQKYGSWKSLYLKYYLAAAVSDLPEIKKLSIKTALEILWLGWWLRKIILRLSQLTSKYLE